MPTALVAALMWRLQCDVYRARVAPPPERLRVKVAACGKDNSVVTHHKATVLLRQFFNGSAEIEV